MSGTAPASQTDSTERGLGLASWYTAGRSDGFGDRLLMFDNSGAASLELLRFRPGLAAEPGFEDLLRQRVQRLSTFKHPSFSAVRTVDHLEDGEGLALVSNHIAGKRLSELLDARRTPAGLHPAFVSWLVQQITPLVASLQAHGYDIVHGALTIDRIILTPEGHIAIVEHVLGSALRGLEMSPTRLWREFGIVSRPTSRGEACLDARGDIMQVGVVALSLLLGRRVPLQEVQEQLPALLDEFSATPSAKSSLFSAPLRQWLERAMQLHPQAYRSAAEAQEGLRELPAQAISSLPALLNSMMPGATMALPAPEPNPLTLEAPPEPSVASDFLPASSSPVDAPVLMADTPVQETAVPIPSVTLKTETAPIVDLATLLPPTAADLSRTESGTLEMASMSETRPTPFTAHTPEDQTRSLVGPLRRWVIIGLAALAAVQAVVIGVMATRRPAPAAAAAAVPMAITLDAGRAGATVFIDGQAAGTAPLTLTLNPGTKSIRIEDAPALIPVPGTTASAGTPPSAAQTAQQQRTGSVRFTSPVDLEVLEGNRSLGRTSEGALVLSPGTHQLDLVNTDLGFRTRQSVTIRAGEVAAFTLTTPMGRLSVNAQPWAQVWVDQNQVGETPIANLAVPIGQHEITFRHPQLGERKESVTVRFDGVTRLSTTFGR